MFIEQILNKYKFNYFYLIFDFHFSVTAFWHSMNFFLCLCVSSNFEKLLAFAAAIIQVFSK